MAYKMETILAMKRLNSKDEKDAIDDVIAKRYESNKELLKLLSDCLEENKDLRFGQAIEILFGTVPFNEESYDTLQRYNDK